MNKIGKNEIIAQSLENSAQNINNCLALHAEELEKVSGLTEFKDRISREAKIDITAKIHPTAFINPLAKIGPGVKIGPRTIIGSGVTVGADTVIGPDCYISHQTKIGEDCVVGKNVHTATGCEIGDAVRLGNGSVLSMGNKIGNRVQIGSNVYCWAWVKVKAGAMIKHSVVLSRHVFVGLGAVIGARSVLDEGAEVKSEAKIFNSYLGVDAKVTTKTEVQNCFIADQRKVSKNTRNDFSHTDDARGR